MGHGIGPAQVAGAQSGFNALSQALQQLATNKFQAQQQAQNQAQIDIAKQRADSEEQERKDRAAQWKSESDYREKELGLRQDAATLQRQQLIQQAAQGILKGQPYPGDHIVAGDTPDTETHTIPGMGPGGTDLNLSLPSHQAYVAQQAQNAQEQADLTRTLSAPAEEAKTREQTAQQNAESERQLKALAIEHTNRLSELAQNNEYETKRQNSSLAAQKAMRDSENALGLQKTIIEATGGMQGMPSLGSTVSTGPDGSPQVQTPNTSDFLTNTVRQLRDGQMSTDQLKKQYPKQAAFILRTANQQGISGLTDKQTEQLQDLNSVAKVVPILKRMNHIIQQFPNEVFNPLSDAGKQYAADKATVEGALPTISRSLSGVKRFNGMEMDQYKNYLLPDRGIKVGPIDATKTGPNRSKYDQFVTHDIQDAFNTVTQNLGQGQKDIIKERIGLNNLPSLGSAIKTPGQQTGTPTGMTPALPMPPSNKVTQWVFGPDGKLVPAGGSQ